MEPAATTSESLAYPLSYDTSNPDVTMSQGKKDAGSGSDERKMSLKCKSCGEEFDSTFTVDDFSLLSNNQLDSGTLHICPDCGSLSIYELKDYRMPR